ncbi:MAG: efflux RND transporter periplasmic adaptor subunit [Acetobacteraceae bacterium]|nr:efflux RND transporter periplasmic adaptor subunit [Acetobacteraceae bacterium]
MAARAGAADPRRYCAWALAVVVCASLSGCKDENKLAVPPPAKVGVAHPLQQNVTPYFEGTGNTVAVAQVDLVARVQGFLSSINYQDGAAVKQGQVLFVIEQAPYQAQLQQAQAQLSIAQANLVQTQAEFDRQQTLVRTNASPQATLDQARAARDTAQGNVTNAQAGLTIAAINLGYTHVAAPFDGVVSQHLQSVGALVGTGGATPLATLVEQKPIFVTFNVSEQDVLRIRARRTGPPITPADWSRIPVEIGLMNEEGYPHKGVIQYIAPQLDPQTGTIMVRGVFDNNDLSLLPGFFARVRVPVGEPAVALLVPNRILGTSQQGRYVLVVDAQNEVEQRTVKVGAVVGDLRVIESGLKPDDRVIVTGSARAIPGHAVAATDTSIAAAGPVPPAATGTASK